MEIQQRFAEARSWLIDLQRNICTALNAIDQQEQFVADAWERNADYSGITCTIKNGRVFEKGGVNFSCISGKSLPHVALAHKTYLKNHSGTLPFSVCGLSLVLHPLNPYVPTVHMNIRFFIAFPENHAPVWWFGGGDDLTPCYGFVADCQHWHQTIKTVCDGLSADAYHRYKTWCDQYFHLPHRKEQRGIGGFFFDELHNSSFEQCFAFFKATGESFLTAYLPIVRKRMTRTYGARQRAFQAMRRGRYVEFNLLYDRGTKFGIESGGRAESILVSMPPQAHWHYQWIPEPESEEARLTTYFLQPRDWLALSSISA